MAQGTGPASACAYSVKLPVGDDLSLGTSVDYPGVYSSLMTRCGANDPVTSAFNGIAAALEPVPFLAASQYLGPGSTLSLPVAPRPAVTDIVFNVTNTTGALLATLLRREGSEALSCARTNGIIGDFKAAVCCDILPPLFWYVSAWYLMAWAMCCCGLPAACLGRKRFPREPWGPAYEDSLSMPLALATGARRSGGKKAGPADAYDASGEVDGGRFDGAAAAVDVSSASASGQSGEVELTTAGAYPGGGVHRRSAPGSGGRRRGGDDYDDDGQDEYLEEEGEGGRGKARGGRGGWSMGGSNRKQRGSAAVPVRLSSGATAI